MCGAQRHKIHRQCGSFAVQKKTRQFSPCIALASVVDFDVILDIHPIQSGAVMVSCLVSMCVSTLVPCFNCLGCQESSLAADHFG